MRRFYSHLFVTVISIWFFVGCGGGSGSNSGVAVAPDLTINELPQASDGQVLGINALPPGVYAISEIHFFSRSEPNLEGGMKQIMKEMGHPKKGDTVYSRGDSWASSVNVVIPLSIHITDKEVIFDDPRRYSASILKKHWSWSISTRGEETNGQIDEILKDLKHGDNGYYLKSYSPYIITRKVGFQIKGSNLTMGYFEKTSEVSLNARFVYSKVEDFPPKYPSLVLKKSNKEIGE